MSDSTCVIASEQIENSPVATISGHLRPKRSPSGLKKKAPDRNPTWKALETRPKWAVSIPSSVAMLRAVDATG